MNQTITNWLGWIILAIIVYAFLPDNIKVPYLALVMLGGLAIVERGGPGGRGGVSQLIQQLEGKRVVT